MVCISYINIGFIKYVNEVSRFLFELCWQENICKHTQVLICCCIRPAVSLLSYEIKLKW